MTHFSRLSKRSLMLTAMVRVRVAHWTVAGTTIFLVERTTSLQRRKQVVVYTTTRLSHGLLVTESRHCSLIISLNITKLSVYERRPELTRTKPL
ncbi:uncharacterized protein EDB91DRAFT_397544 [Suillus paluster]|uniref:uncharacterized protein n=1 Tax=Suillus paluster TaxID=48578 RepID=UPI001B87EA42|nr:uncharacterized protein EDB91DRAFT_397544 [Suillus paluster]KAG1739193.1 hypothetical protein EDB91DRAFT_397544 [Suillus paluster]